MKCAKIRLESYLHENGYSLVYTKALAHEIDCLIFDPDFAEATSYESYYLNHVVPKYGNPVTLAAKRSMLGRIKNLDLYGVMPSKGHPAFLIGRDSACQLPSAFRCFIDTCRTEWERRRLAASTIASRAGMLAKFFSHLTSRGAACFEDVSEQDIRSYFFDGSSQIRGHDVVKILRLSMLDYIAASHDASCEPVLSRLPQIRKRHRIYPYLTDEERQRIDSMLEMPDHGCLSRRDMAVFTLLYYTGIRRGDLAELRMQDIDWEKDLITIVQGKTGRTNTLPLLPAVGNSILDYVENERPKSASRYLFLSTNRIPGRLSGGSIYDIVEKVLCCAGVRVDGGRKGTHLLRHNLSVSLLKNGTSTPMITEILGHSSPESVNAYLESDEAALKSCALSVADYPIRKEVFEVCLL